ncbi:MAG TPA: hypothetical protein VGS12_09970 [Caulobacteraceae bacterium]|nr:hypothetical protein [Caulobacteraceae bacterium]
MTAERSVRLDYVYEPTWDRTEFRWLDTEEVCPESADITGYGRVLIVSPPREFSAGRWRFTVAFELCPDAGRYPYAVVVGNQSGASREDLQASGAGLYEVSVERTLEAVAPLEVHLKITRAAFHGELRLLGMTVERLGDP